MPPTTIHNGRRPGALEVRYSDGRARPAGKVQSRIFDVLCEPPFRFTGRELVELVYADRQDGGPDWAFNSIHCAILAMNRRWIKNGNLLRIRSEGHSGYRLWIVR